MIAQIGPLVQVGGLRSIGIPHAAGGLLGGAGTGCVIGLLGATISQTIGESSIDTFPIAAAALVVAAALELRTTGKKRPGLRRQTPLGWLCTFGETGGVFAWGFDLGIGYTTKVTTLALFALPAFTLLPGGLLIGATTFATFGFVRALAAVSVARTYGRDSSDASYCLGDAQQTLSRLTALAAAVAAAAVVILGTTS